ncbi:2Fe-2S iron-sulfur cluster-binding protein [Persicitalea jodogahamensis]|uniref:Ferredoxin n=1 Tax=Persicitalea jodogahamensis TaxID=402147 RepID=A0A8J3D7N4_9BACT|nr:2Fe-2S iron-sulfur cluster-binding protein [Persicitalea jodogahamensis]GHB63567.1 ferredoxin [Persicitalea jodogahamensis]
MARITYITNTDESITLEAFSGSLMELAVQNGVPGIDGDCGGVCSCATCHVHVAPEYMAIVGEPEEIEMDMLELNDDVDEYSRLGCQVQISEALDGITLTVAR